MADLLLHEQWVVARFDEVGDVGMPQGVHRQLCRQTCRLQNARMAFELARSVDSASCFSPLRRSAKYSSIWCADQVHGYSLLCSWNRVTTLHDDLMNAMVKPRASSCDRQPSSIASNTRSSARSSPTSPSARNAGTLPGTISIAVLYAKNSH